MRFLGNISLIAHGEVVRREPGFWERFKQVFSRDKALERRDTQTLMTTAHLLAGVKRALEGVGITNAVLLVIDGVVLFEDKVGNPHDVDELFAAFYENEALYGRSFHELSLTVEHLEAGLATVIALTATGDRMSDVSRVELVVSGRIAALLGDGPNVNDSFGTPARPEAHRLQFERFVARVRDGLAAALPEVTVSMPTVAARIVRPGPVRAEVGDDPWYRVHPDVDAAVDAAIWTAAMGWAWHPEYTVIEASGETIGPLAAHVVRAGGVGPSGGSVPDELADERSAGWEDEDRFAADADTSDAGAGEED